MKTRATQLLKTITVSLLALIFLSSTAVAEASIDNLQIMPASQKLAISYTLTDPDSSFFTAMTDALKSGKKLKIVHNIRIRPVGLFAGEIAEVRVPMFVHYDLLDTRFLAGEKPNRLSVMANEAATQNFLYTVRNVPFVPPGKLKTGDEYIVEVTLRYTEADDNARRWFRRLSPLSWFDEKLTAEALYIAR